MKKSISGLLIVLALTAGSLRANPWDDGRTAFEKADYPAAIRAWETALAVEAPSAALYQNLALAQERGGQPVAAILSLRRALLLDPARESVRVDLSRLERSQGIEFHKPDWRTQLGERVPAAFLYGAGAAVFWVGAFLLLRSFFRRSVRMGVGAVILAGLGAVVFAAGYLSDPRIAGQRLGIVVAEKGVSLLSAPADQSKPLARLPAGSSLAILQKRGEWAYCQSPDGTKGWLPDASVARVVVSRVES